MCLTLVEQHADAVKLPRENTMLNSQSSTLNQPLLPSSAALKGVGGSVSDSIDNWANYIWHQYGKYVAQFK